MTRILVIGAGISGLSTAYLLNEAGYEVTIYTKDLTEDTTSATAGAFWEPYLVKPVDKALKWSKDTFDYMEANIIGKDRSGVKETVVEAYYNHEESDPWWKPAAKNYKRLDKSELNDIYTSGYRMDSLLIDTSLYLPWLLAILKDKGVQIQQMEIKSFNDIPQEFEATINCSGLGAITLCNDSEVYPVRGQVLRVAQNGFNKVIIDENDGNIVYVVPRTNDMIIGGTSQVNDWNLKPNPQDTERILKKLRKILPEFGELEVLEEKVGLRPARNEVRLEKQILGDKIVIHNYGHGGAGFTLSWGCANEVVHLVSEAQLKNKVN